MLCDLLMLYIVPIHIRLSASEGKFNDRIIRMIRVSPMGRECLHRVSSRTTRLMKRRFKFGCSHWCDTHTKKRRATLHRALHDGPLHSRNNFSFEDEFLV